MKAIILTIAVLIAIAFTATAQDTVLDGTFGNTLSVNAGTKATAYQFTISDDEYFRVDFVNADKDFTFVINTVEENPHPAFPAPRDQGLKFFSIQVQNSSQLTTGVVFRWKYSSVDVDPASMEFLIARGSSWWEFDNYSELLAQSNVIAQSLPNTELMQGVNYFGVFGGKSVVVPEEGDPRYDSFENLYTAEKDVTNTYEFKLDRKQLFHLEFIEPNIDFTFTINRTTSNPGVQLEQGIKGIYFFEIGLNSDQLPGPDGLRYGSVLTFKYPFGIPENIVESTLNFMIFDGIRWKSFSSDSERSSYSAFVTQPTNAFLEFSSLKLTIALVAEETVAPVPSPSAQVSENEPETSNNQPPQGSNSAATSNGPIDSRNPQQSNDIPQDSLGERSTNSATSLAVAVSTMVISAIAIFVSQF